MNGAIFRNINRPFVQSFRAGESDCTGNYFLQYYMPLAEIKDFKELINNERFFDQLITTESNKKLSKC